MQDIGLEILLYIAPMYFANSSALLFGSGRRKIDMGVKFIDGNPLLGEGKTFRGLVSGVGAGTLVALLISYLGGQTVGTFHPNYLLLGFLLSLGAILGDLAGSFIKRRIGAARGKDVPVLDQLDFVAGAVIVASPLFIPTVLELAIIIVLTLVVHRASNYVAFKLGLKKVPW